MRHSHGKIVHQQFDPLYINWRCLLLKAWVFLRVQCCLVRLLSLRDSDLVNDFSAMLQDYAFRS